MKRLILLGLLVLVSQSCHRQEYVLFNDPTTGPYLYQEKSEPAVIEKPSTFAQADTAKTLTDERQLNMVLPPQPSLTLLEVKKPQRVFVRKNPIKVKKLAQQNGNPLFHKKTDEPEPRPSRGLGVASLVFGALGLVLLIPSLLTMGLAGLAFTGFVSGIIGLFLGIFSLIRVKNSSDVPTGRNAAQVGVVISTLTSMVGGLLLMSILLAALSSGFLSCS
ncbi:hypothetical protein [Persicitalea sp.]|uniref:hypothetical protein n=1 Tax=Persicitalea sp. TaxID=3100273 RepID=UPI0035933F93